eukprot:PITA_04147
MVDPAKIVVIVNLEAPKNVKQLHTMFGHTGYYRKSIKSYAQITTPMEKSLKKDVTFCWDEECQRSLDVLKEKLVIALILVFPDWKKEFHVHVDASCIALGAVSTQRGEGEIDHPIAFASRKLSKAENNFPTTECEGLEYDFEVIVKSGLLNAGLDHLSRIETREEPTNLEEGLPDVQLFGVRIANDYFADIIQFLTTGTTPKGYSTKRKKELVVRATDFSVIAEHLYNMGIDEILRRYVLEFERSSILAEAHGGVAGGHYAGRATVQRILYAELWWLTLHKDCKAYCRACDACQRTRKPS